MVNIKQIFIALTVFIAGCGGGGSSDIAFKSNAGNAIYLNGTAAIGAPISNQIVSIKCKSNVNPFYATGTTTTAVNGEFTISIPNAISPCMLEVNAAGVLLHAISNKANGVANITPLTEALTATVLGNNNLAELFAQFDASTADKISIQATSAEIEKAWTQLKSSLEKAGFSTTGITIEPTQATLSAAFNGVAGNSYDNLLDAIKNANLSKNHLYQMSSALVKLSSTGSELSNQFLQWSDFGSEAAGNKWDCVKDNKTGLTWEVKRNESNHMRHKGHTYTWFSNSQWWFDSKKNSYSLEKNIGTTGPNYLNGGSTGKELSMTCFGLSDTTRCNISSYISAVNSTKLCGKENWRLPDPSELLSLIKNDLIAPMIDHDFFPYIVATNDVDTAYWTRTPSPNNKDFAFHASFGTGKIADGLKESARPVMLVSDTIENPTEISKADWDVCKTNIAPSRPNSRYSIAGDEVTDNVTGLIWQRCEMGRSGSGCDIGFPFSYKFTNLNSVVSSIATSSKPWRLPTKNELASLIETKCTNPAINSSAFPNTSLTAFWSSTVNKLYPSASWAVNFYNGFVEVIPADTQLHLRLVR